MMSVVMIDMMLMGIMIEVYFVNLILKKFVEIIFIKLDIISGRLVVLVMKLVVMIKVSVVWGENCSVSSMVMMIGVRISVVLLLVNRVDMVVFNRISSMNSMWL